MAEGNTVKDDSAFSCRGSAFSVETTETAELDFALCELSAAEIEGIGKNLKDIAVSHQDRHFGEVVVRLISACDVEVMFITTRIATGPLITVLGASRPAKVRLLERVMSVVGTVAILRRASGL